MVCLFAPIIYAKNYASTIRRDLSGIRITLHRARPKHHREYNLALLQRSVLPKMLSLPRHELILKFLII